MEWISVKERLPDEGIAVLCSRSDAGIIVGEVNIIYDFFEKTHNAVWNECQEFIEIDVTHWMPLPEPPKP